MPSRETELPPIESVRPDAPLRLDVAAALAYPHGGMTASGLRREAKRGRLMIERTAGKDFTTLAAIEGMRELCRYDARVPDSGSEKPERKEGGVPSGLSLTAADISP